MIPIEEATRSCDVLTGFFILIIASIIIAEVLYTNSVKRKAKKAVIEAKRKLQALYDAEKRKIQTQHFVSGYEAKERIKELERKLTEKEVQLKQAQDNYNRLASIAERARNGKK